MSCGVGFWLQRRAATALEGHRRILFRGSGGGGPPYGIARSAFGQPSLQTRRDLRRQRIIPLQIAEAREVPVGRLQRQPLFDGEGRKVRIGDVARAPHVGHQPSKNLGVTLSRLGGEHDGKSEPLHRTIMAGCLDVNSALNRDRPTRTRTH